MPAPLVAAIAADFVAAHGRQPLAVFAAPGRVNLIGEHTDYNDGLTLPVALGRRTYAAVAARHDGRLRAVSRQQGAPIEVTPADQRPGGVSGWVAHVAGVLWALREDGLAVPGLDVLIDSTVPMGAGLSSSAALECSVALGACAAAGIDVDEGMRDRLVAACIRAENEVAGAPTGGMDQTIALHARPGHALLIDVRAHRREHVPVALPDTTLLAVDTRVRHHLADGQYGRRRDECERAARRLGVPSLRDAALAQVEGLADDVLRRRARHVVTEIARVPAAVSALRRADTAALGDLFVASHLSLRDDYEVSCPELDVVVDTALAAGATGARMTGGGFGGSVIALVPTGRVGTVSAALGRAFEHRGWPTPGILPVEACGRADEVR